MQKRLILGTIAGGLVLFVWYMVANALPGHQASIHALPDDAAVVRELERLHVEPGTYFFNRLPGALGVGPGYWGWMTLHRSADYAFLPSLAGSLLMQMLVAFGLSNLLLRSRPATFWGHLRSVMLAAGVAVVAGPLTYWNWSWFSLPYALTQVVDVLVGFALAGAVLAKLVGPPVTTPK